jgi:hypothetical protein
MAVQANTMYGVPDWARDNDPEDHKEDPVGWKPPPTWGKESLRHQHRTTVTDDEAGCVDEEMFIPLQGASFLLSIVAVGLALWGCTLYLAERVRPPLFLILIAAMCTLALALRIPDMWVREDCWGCMTATLLAGSTATTVFLLAVFAMNDIAPIGCPSVE